MSSESATAREKDWAAQCSGQLLWWGLPLLAGISAGQLDLSVAGEGFVWAGALAWMGIGCVLNALRCGRRHCFFSGPVFFGSAIVAALFGLRVLSGTHVLNDVLWATVALVAASYLPEIFVGKYVHRG